MFRRHIVSVTRYVCNPSTVTQGVGGVRFANSTLGIIRESQLMKQFINALTPVKYDLPFPLA